MAQLIVIDNYDSFTYNVVQYLQELKAKVTVFRNDKITLSKMKQLKFDGIVISPGPCTPKEAGISNDVIRAFSGKKPLLGICLGHQCIGYAFGAKIVQAKNIMHGKTSEIYHRKTDVFRSLPSPFDATRYHSLVIKKETLPKELTITAKTKKGEIMGVAHKSHPTFGIQFHPESIMTKQGHALLNNFIQISDKWKSKK